MNQYIAKFWPWLRSRAATKQVICIGIALAVSAMTLNLNLFRVEAYFYDLRMRLKGSDHADNRIVLIKLDENKAGIKDHVAALQNILAQKPAILAYLNRFDPSDTESNPKAAEDFVRLASRASEYGTKLFMGTDVDLGGEVLPPYPLSLLPHSPAIIHKDGTIFGEDKVVRRSVLTIFDEPSLHLRIAHPELSREQLLKKAESVRGAYFFKPADAWHVLIRYPYDTTGAGKNSFPVYSFAQWLGNPPAGDLSGKIVLVGELSKESINDFAFTPFSRITYQNPRLLIHASILNTLLKDNGIKIVSTKVDIALTLFLAFVLSYITIMFSPTRGVISLLMLSGILFLSSLILFAGFGLWLRLVHPLFAMFFTYYLIVPYRAILEYKKRWEVQQKHDLLVQVEEMKGNFLSLMSHDLKTPVARIQGLAELVIRQGGLQGDQEKELRQIVESTENLDKFISKILNLTKVESNEIKLNRKSKDINKILEQCVQKLEFQARSKNIEVALNLEPLFPIQIDAALIIQVFTNIIDNAIKYSPAGSKIEVSSKEIGDRVEVVIKDSGPGMDEKESRQLFTKFFRGLSHPGDQTKGSGLGLYLSKYFIELHEGSVKAQTKKGEGSRFVVQLPIQSSSP